MGTGGGGGARLGKDREDLRSGDAVRVPVERVLPLCGYTGTEECKAPAAVSSAKIPCIYDRNERRSVRFVTDFGAFFKKKTGAERKKVQKRGSILQKRRDNTGKNGGSCGKMSIKKD